MKFYNIKHLYNFASKEEAIELFIEQGHDETEVRDILEKYWNRKENLDGEEKILRDINLFYNDKENGYAKLKDLVQNKLLNKKERKIKKQKTIEVASDGVSKKIWENDDYVAWKICTHEGAKEIAQYNRTMITWCIAAEQSHWNTYRRNKSRFIFVFKKDFEKELTNKYNSLGTQNRGWMPKDFQDKVAIEILDGGTINFSINKYWDANDDEHRLSEMNEGIQNVARELQEMFIRLKAERLAKEV